MDYQLKGKLAYVSAGAHGIGEAIADLLTQEGAEVIVADSDADVLRKKAGKWRATITADLATGAGVDDATAYALDKFGALRTSSSTTWVSETRRRSKTCPTKYGPSPFK